MVAEEPEHEHKQELQKTGKRTETMRREFETKVSKSEAEEMKKITRVVLAETNENMIIKNNKISKLKGCIQRLRTKTENMEKTRAMLEVSHAMLEKSHAMLEKSHATLKKEKMEAEQEIEQLRMLRKLESQATSSFTSLKVTPVRNAVHGEYSLSEDGRILRLVREYGHHWTFIGKKIGRTPDSVRLRFARL